MRIKVRDGNTPYKNLILLDVSEIYYKDGEEGMFIVTSYGRIFRVDDVVKAKYNFYVDKLFENCFLDLADKYAYLV